MRPIITALVFCLLITVAHAQEPLEPVHSDEWNARVAAGLPGEPEPTLIESPDQEAIQALIDRVDTLTAQMKTLSLTNDRLEAELARIENAKEANRNTGPTGFRTSSGRNLTRLAIEPETGVVVRSAGVWISRHIGSVWVLECVQNEHGEFVNKIPIVYGSYPEAWGGQQQQQRQAPPPATNYNFGPQG